MSPGGHVMLRGIALLGLALAAGGEAVAAATSPGLAEAVRDCSALASRDERLACFDRVAATIPASPTAAASPGAGGASLAAAATSPDPQVRFGFSEGQLQRAADEQSPGKSKLEALRARIAAARRIANRGWRITLDNGQVWRQVSPSEYLDPQVGTEVVIQPASFGSFLLVDASRHSARMHREE
jgi:hypothetical protein